MYLHGQLYKIVPIVILVCNYTFSTSFKKLTSKNNNNYSIYLGTQLGNLVNNSNN